MIPFQEIKRKIAIDRKVEDLKSTSSMFLCLLFFSDLQCALSAPSPLSIPPLLPLVV